ncbi:MAG: ASPIC/UnbV domain-containing protein, partial [Armatimonadota bacterium]|nr:ASPIC/UnbV domain-containing protein [Armatimonadota bacterium]
RSAIGAQVLLFWKDAQGHELQQLQQVSSASGFCAQNDARLHFGLGKSAQLEKAVIRWPFAGSSPQTVPASALKMDTVNAVKEPS